MKELVNTLIKQANIDEATALKVIGVVKTYLGDKLPGPIGDQVKNALDGLGGDQVNDALDAVKGFFNK